MNNPSFDTLVLKDYATKLFSQAEQQAAADWELVETAIWGRKYPHKEHKDSALTDLTFAYSIGSAFRVCLTGERKALPRLLHLQLITEIANCFRARSEGGRKYCDFLLNDLLKKFETRDAWSEEREKNCKRRFGECITYGKYGETPYDEKDVLVLVGHLTTDIMHSFDEEGGFLYRKNERCAKMWASKIDEFYGHVFDALLARVNELNANESYKNEIVEIAENRDAKLVSLRADGNYDLLLKAIAQEVKRCNELVGLYPKSLETVLLLTWQKYQALQKAHYENENDMAVKFGYFALADDVIPFIRRDKMSIELG